MAGGIVKKAFAQAVAESEAACAWVNRYQLKLDVASLGTKISATYRSIYLGHVNPHVAAQLAIQWFWIAQRNSQLLWLEWVAGEHVYSESLKGNVSFAAYLKAGHDGDLSAVLANSETQNQFPGATKEVSKNFERTLLEGIGMTWLCKADDLMAAGKTIEALDVIANAFCVFGLAQGEQGKLLAEEINNMQRSHIGKVAAEARHSQPGGSRDKRENIRTIWASGNFADRNTCAEEEYAALGFGAFKTARTALMNTPNPNPWPAKGKPRK